MKPRQSATVMLLRDDPFEVLMIRRGSHGAFPSIQVFPGGVIEDADRAPHWQEAFADFDQFEEPQRALRIGAIREVLEETGVLIGHDTYKVRDRSEPFFKTVQSLHMDLRLGSLTHFAHWVTPTFEPKRFETHFYLAKFPTDQNVEIDNSEAISAEWLAPDEAVKLALSGERPIIFPTLANLSLLAQSGDSEHAINMAHSRATKQIQPELVEHSEGRLELRIPSTSEYPITNWVMTTRSFTQNP